MTETIDSIIQELQRRVLNNEPISPASWVNAALMINILAERLDNEMAEFEAMLMEAEAELVSKDVPVSKAKILARKSVDYLAYLKLKAKINRIQEYIMLAKRRAIIQDL